MSQTLYRKYRPQQFSELIGQNHIKITLENEIVSGSVVHAYLFSGPRGTGKTTVARLLAKALNCQNRKKDEFEPCGKCSSCVDIKENRSIDIIEVDAASQTGVDNVRENIVENVRFSSFRDKYKIFIIDEVHMLSLSAFNALLKTLEEPPENVIFILCTTELYKIPETIISRCQRFDFKKIDLATLADYLKKIANEEGYKIDDMVSTNIARLSGGFTRDALSILGQVLSLGKKDIKEEDTLAILPRSDFESVVNLVDFLVLKDSRGGVELINNLIDDGVDLEHFTLSLIDYLRDLSLAKLGLKNDENILEQSENLEMDFLLKAINIFINKLQALKNAEIIQLPLEMAVIELCLGKTKDSLQKTINIKEVVLPVQEIKETIIQEEIVDVMADEKKTEQSHADIGDITLEIIQEKWQDVINQSKAVNHSVTVALQTAMPTLLSSNNLEISFEHSFYCERFKEVKSRLLIEQVLKNVFGCDLVVKCIAMSDDKKNELSQMRTEQSQNENSDIDRLVADFGGKVVE